MKTRFPTVIAGIGCVLLASCYPVNEHPKEKKVPKAPDKTATTPDPLKIKEQEEAQQKAKEEEAQVREKVEEKQETTTEQPKTSAEPKRDYAFANKVPGKDGFVFSPYNNKVVDVRDIPSGTLVQDPTYPAAEKKYFRVP